MSMLQSGEKRRVASLARQSKINQSNQKNITEYIRAGRCRSLPSSSIDLRSFSQCTTVLQMKQPNLIFPHNAAIQCRYDRGEIEYLPRNGNAFDSSVSELLNLRAADASRAFEAPKKSLFHSAMCPCTFLTLCPGVCFCAIMRSFCEAHSNWTQSSAPWNFNLLCLSPRTTRGLLCLLLVLHCCAVADCASYREITHEHTHYTKPNRTAEVWIVNMEMHGLRAEARHL